MGSKNARLLDVGVVVIAVIASAAGGFVVGREMPADATSARDSSVEQWWTDHREDVAALRSSVRDSQRALKQQDLEGLSAACLAMHDDAAITLRSALPAPDSELTAELDGAIEDAHAAAHMCLAAQAGSLNSYAGEFASQMAASDRQLEAAESLMGGQPAAA